MSFLDIQQFIIDFFKMIVLLISEDYELVSLLHSLLELFYTAEKIVSFFFSKKIFV